MIPVFIAKQTRQHATAEGEGSRRRAGMLCLAMGALLCLTGCGYAGQPNLSGSRAGSSVSVLQATPSSIGFGNVVSGQRYSQTIRLSNPGTADLNLKQIKVSGSGFSTSGISLPLILPAGQSATFSAAFISTASGAASGGITIASDTPGSRATAMTIGMSATVIPASAQLTASPSALNFGNSTLAVAVAQNVTLTNTGNTTVNISSVSATGAGFSANGGANVTLTANQTVNVAVTFDPTSSGPTAGSLIVISDGGALEIGLAGTGVNASVQHSVALRWNPSTSTVAGYYVYRGDGMNGALSRLVPSITPATNFRDGTVVGGQTYNYAVASVDFDNVESTYSNQSFVTIPGN